ncbi:hypothetical protein M405DRAFT_930393 [Rhizopogon salebrosus TDB-379]|nr:hypothetical protein M405DRAFT_930393 [Rhizopogon salebrosus TDB-379]
MSNTWLSHQTCKTHQLTKQQQLLAKKSSCGYEEWQESLRTSLAQTVSAARILARVQKISGFIE